MYASAKGLDLRIVHRASGDQVTSLRIGELDLGLVHDAVEDSSILTERLYPGEPMAAFLPAGHPLAEQDTVTPADLRDEVLIVPPRSIDAVLHRRLLALVGGAGYVFSGVRESAGADPRDLLFTVASGTGITLAGMSAGQAAGGIGDLVACRPLAVPVRMPNTLLAYTQEARRRLDGAIIAALGLARQFRVVD
jgi:DNA-binding transcriptional LysR family regulator